MFYTLTISQNMSESLTVVGPVAAESTPQAKADGEEMIKLIWNKTKQEKQKKPLLTCLTAADFTFASSAVIIKYYIVGNN